MKRLSLRFSLRTFFVLLTAVCVWLGYNADIVRNRKMLMHGSPLDPCLTISIDLDRQFKLSWIRRLLGDKMYPFAIQSHCMTKEQLDEMRSVYPEMWVPGTDREIELTRYPGMTPAKLDAARIVLRRQMADSVRRMAEAQSCPLPAPEAPK